MWTCISRKYVKTKRKSYEGKINRKFHGDKILKECLFLKQIETTCPKYFLKNVKMLSNKKRYLNILAKEISSNNSDKENSYKESANEE